MEAIYADVTISMSEFKKNPAAVLRDAKSKPVAVLNHNKVSFYMIEPALFQTMLEELSDQDLHVRCFHVWASVLAPLKLTLMRSKKNSF